MRKIRKLFQTKSARLEFLTLWSEPHATSSPSINVLIYSPLIQVSNLLVCHFTFHLSFPMHFSHHFVFDVNAFSYLIV